jgi:hypothetical protein
LEKYLLLPPPVTLFQDDGIALSKFSRMDRYEAASRTVLSLAESNSEDRPAIVHWLNSLVLELRQDSTAFSRSRAQERQIIESRTRNFNWNSSAPWLFFVRQGWTDRTFPEMIGIAQIMADGTGIELDREAKRRKSILFQWMDQHWHVLQPIANTMKIQLRPPKPESISYI